MRYPVLACLCLAMSACGGDFSNDDLEFLNALPQREDLAVKLPGGRQKGAGQRLSPDKGALAVRLGEASQLVGDTDETGQEFNEGVDGLLSFLEAIRQLPPTRREPDRRIWGPYRDNNHPGFDTRFVMTRAGERFDYQLEYRRTNQGEDAWWAFLVGAFQADAGIRKGTGDISLETGRARGKAFTTGMEALDRLEIHYQTQALPTRVELVFDYALPALLPAKYVFREGAGSVVEMTFEIGGTDLVPGGQPEDVALTTRWAPDGRGLGSLEVLRGDITGAKYTECWDRLGRVTFIARSWDFFTPTEGDRTTCPDVSALDP
ncbi:hypothetical protein LZ198_33870 [Myxococcus sp. K15C18031901]|uniref:hypothetical protein n=1 Tax=Myxococcus dinghuensis TaxID=2906761 RepID=UPI0020A74D4E|nr:hypothetical protein [Myxococcus dinghuensis]MCP3103878.1 hypothetical protein [Myxococcus dinghuensis]